MQVGAKMGSFGRKKQQSPSLSRRRAPCNRSLSVSLSLDKERLELVSHKVIKYTTVKR